jgi:hypothetical protein
MVFACAIEDAATIAKLPGCADYTSARRPRLRRGVTLRGKYVPEVGPNFRAKGEKLPGD